MPPGAAVGADGSGPVPASSSGPVSVFSRLPRVSLYGHLAVKCFPLQRRQETLPAPGLVGLARLLLPSSEDCSTSGIFQ